MMMQCLEKLLRLEPGTTRRPGFPLGVTKGGRLPFNMQEGGEGSETPPKMNRGGPEAPLPGLCDLAELAR